MVVNYEVTVDHKEGQTLHIKELAEPFQHLKQLYIQKHGFDPTSYFYYDGNIDDIRKKTYVPNL
jgi:hypothetical protein